MKIIPFKIRFYIISYLLLTLPLTSEKNTSGYSLCSLNAFWMIMSYLCRNSGKHQSLIQCLGIETTWTYSHGRAIAIAIVWFRFIANNPS